MQYNKDEHLLQNDKEITTQKGDFFEPSIYLSSLGCLWSLTIIHL